MKAIDKKIEQLQRKVQSSLLTKEELGKTIISPGLYGKISGTTGYFIIANENIRMIIRY